VLAAAKSGGANKGEPWAFERLYAEYAPIVAGFLRLRGSAEPEELTNDVFMSSFAGLPRFAGNERQFRSWIFTIARRRLIDERRRRSARPVDSYPSEELVDQVGGNAEHEAVEAMEAAWVVRMCAALPADQREVVYLRVAADLSLRQVADVMGKSVGAVKQLQRRGLMALRERVEREGVTL
jgi:RNA polymerase sigma-70 factor (ECF subfamily)